CGAPTGLGTATVTCTFTISSSSAGLFKANADAVLTIAGTFNPVTGIHRDTDPTTAAIGPGPNGSSFAQKQYVDLSTSITPDKSNEVGQQHVFNVTVTSIGGPITAAVITTSVAPPPGTQSTTCGAPAGVGTSTVTCTLTINNPTAGLFTANADVVAT